MVAAAKQAKHGRCLVVFLMSDPYRPPQTLIYLNAPPFIRALGCGGCGLGCAILFFVVFVFGGLVGVLVFGWRTLLGG